MNPSYYELGDHTEVVNIHYNPDMVCFEKLLSVFWKNHNPSIPNQRQYRSLILYHNDKQNILAQESLTLARQKSPDEVQTEILPTEVYYNAEDYHQKYILQQHPWLVTALQIQTGEELVKSHVCTRLNGYLSGYGERENFLKEAKGLGLNDKMIEYVKTEIRSRQLLMANSIEKHVA